MLNDILSFLKQIMRKRNGFHQGFVVGAIFTAVWVLLFLQVVGQLLGR